jgi:ATP-dependent protease ClpP protease subunit
MKGLNLVAKSKKEAEVVLYGTVAQWNSFNALMLLQVIQEAEKENYERLTIRILYSPGGSIFEGLAMISLLQETSLETVCRIESIAASMASAIAMGCDKVEMSKGGRMMIHHGSGGAYGSAKTMKTTAKLLESLNETMAEMYAAKSGKTAEWVLENWMAEGQDTWFTAKEAEKSGLIDSVFGNRVKPMKEESAEAAFDFSKLVAHYEAQVADMDLSDEEVINNYMNIFEKFPKLAALVGKTTDEITSEVIAAVNEELVAKGLKSIQLIPTSAQEALTTQAKNDADKVIALNAVLDAVAKKLDPEHKGEVTQTAVVGKITTMKDEITTANAKIVKLGGKPGATHTTPNKPTGDNLDDDEETPEQAIAKLPHNAALDNNPLYN